MKTRLLLSVILISLFMFSKAQVDPIDMIARLGKGINLGNTLELENQLNQYPYIDTYYFSDYKKAGFKHLRLPVRWGPTTSHAEPYTLDNDWLLKVDTVLNMALDAGLLVVLNAHHEDWLTENGSDPDSIARSVK